MPRAPKECGKQGCEERVRGRKYCDAHTQAWQGSTRSGTHTSAADQRLRAQVLLEEPFCACGAPATEAGHIRPHAYGGRYERDNLRGQCRPCNVRQIASDRVKYGVV
jgi:5-methylcytosine-specific restriction endonuclease McrA